MAIIVSNPFSITYTSIRAGKQCYRNCKTLAEAEAWVAVKARSWRIEEYDYGTKQWTVVSTGGREVIS